MGTTDEDKTELEHLGFTFTASMTPYSSPHYHMHVKGPNFQGDKNAIAFDVDDDDLSALRSALSHWRSKSMTQLLSNER